MNVTTVDLASQSPELIARLAKPGLLLAVPDRARSANVMTIGWATYGRIWGQPMCMVFVRPSRYTYELINEAGTFTVNCMPEGAEKAVARCGAVSGRQVDKVAEQGWTVQNGLAVPAPYLSEAAIHVECRTVFKAKVTQDLEAGLLARSYPRGDLHDIYFGQVMGVYRHG